MPPQPGLPPAAVEAIQQKCYSDAIPLLEAFCRDHTGNPSNNPSKEYCQAQIWLVKAYQVTGQSDRAIALCRQMTYSSHPKIQAWAQQTLPSLEAATIQVPAASEESVQPQPSVQAQTEESDPVPTYPPLTPEDAEATLKRGNKALKMQRYAEAVENLEAYCYGVDPSTKDYEQAQTWLAKAYKGDEQVEKAIDLCQTLTNSPKPFIQIWAKQYLQAIAPELVTPPSSTESAESIESADAPQSSPDGSPAAPTSASNVVPLPKAGRSNRRGIKLSMKQVAGNLVLASGATLSLLFGMVLVLSLSLVFIVGSNDPTTGLIISILITLAISVASFFLSPIIMDLMQGWIYRTQWVSLSQIERKSPETARVIRLICQQKKLRHPRLGIINDQNPTAFTYGSLPNSARLVVSEGLFTYLDEDEVATVYAHELGHIVHWDFAVMTLAATLVQITYLLYVYTREMADRLGDGDMEKKLKNAAKTTAMMAYVFYVVGEYLLLYLSRTREYYADHFAAEMTGNPNGLSRALVKIAYGIVEEGKRTQEPSKVLQGTRALGIADSNAAVFTGTAYRVASEPYKVGKVFLWDMFNPWAWWMELSSTHPLTGKRVRALSTYAEQLGLDTEFDMARVIREGHSLNKKRLYGNFVTDLLLLRADLLGAVAGTLIGAWLLSLGFIPAIAIVSIGLFGFGLGTILKTFVTFPSFSRAPATDVLTLMSDPYAGPLRGQPVKLSGEIIGRGDAGSRFGSDLKLQDNTGMIYLHYSSRFGPLGNFLFGMTQAESFVRQQVAVVGWFRRGVMPSVDLMLMTCPEKWTVNSYHRFWSILLGLGAIVLSFVLPSLSI